MLSSLFFFDRSEINFSRCDVIQFASRTDARVEIDTETALGQWHRELCDVDYEVMQVVVTLHQWARFGDVAKFQNFIMKKLNQRFFVLIYRGKFIF